MKQDFKLGNEPNSKSDIICKNVLCQQFLLRCLRKRLVVDLSSADFGCWIAVSVSASWIIDSICVCCWIISNN
jgi:hypothetical protein